MVAFVNGVPRVIHMDDLFPITEKGAFVFAEPNQKFKKNNVWAMLIEKLWAKINVNYEKLVAGWAHEALTVFTGAGSLDYLMSNLDLEQTWILLSKNLEKGHLVGCGTKGAGDDSLSLDTGLA
jgi:hypothetical protein